MALKSSICSQLPNVYLQPSSLLNPSHNYPTTQLTAPLGVRKASQTRHVPNCTQDLPSISTLALHQLSPSRFMAAPFLYTKIPGVTFDFSCSLTPHTQCVNSIVLGFPCHYGLSQTTSWPTSLPPGASIIARASTPWSGSLPSPFLLDTLFSTSSQSDPFKSSVRPVCQSLFKILQQLLSSPRTKAKVSTSL